MGAARGLIVAAGGARVICSRRYTADRRGGVATLAPGHSDPAAPSLAPECARRAPMAEDVHPTPGTERPGQDAGLETDLSDKPASAGPEVGPEPEVHGEAASTSGTVWKIPVEDLRPTKPAEAEPASLLEELPLWWTPGQARIWLTLEDPGSVLDERMLEVRRLTLEWATRKGAGLHVGMDPSKVPDHLLQAGRLDKLRSRGRKGSSLERSDRSAEDWTEERFDEDKRGRLVLLGPASWRDVLLARGRRAGGKSNICAGSSGAG